MKLSIIIPIYNARMYLRKCLETIIACPFAEMECILINDGSSDDSLLLCEEYAQKDHRFYVIDKENEGVSVARNIGLIHASGDYVFFLDADDYIDVRKWTTILNAVEEQYDLIVFSYYTLLPNGVVKEELFPIPSDEVKDMEVGRKLLLASPRLNTCWGKLMRRQLIIENKLEFRKEIKIGEDTVFVLDYFQIINNISIRNESILYYRQHGASAMHQINMRRKMEDFKLIYMYRKSLAMEWKDDQLTKEMNRQFFSVITDLFLECSVYNSFECAKRTYTRVVKSNMVQEVINGIAYKALTPGYKKIEYALMKKNMFGCLTIYFKFKIRFKQDKCLK